ncbi:hypothetical protein A2917_00275 [Candidatus Nomurabacteria bacterium RIFCSPLOWO2_01_FULL_42_17]|uniref:Peptidoglycan binding-like domain-containing protein n=1 Tax=Candidatus Nomurabacteria bacterium RIFCSPLOWO2_01_FULL_42_17 TaxID=1801780 RepID=A0A1F6XNS9_9BACT|nr:MAG: hypothetical protein A2917_00275 [Candidatus Nomurabacteria bacterium RIFCSPLOWO2_01_FULL_42_17]
MEKLKFILFSVVTLALVGILGYWSISTLQSGPESKARQRIQALEKQNAELAKEIKKLSGEKSTLQFKLAELTPPPAPAASAVIVYKYQDLINELQKLIDDNIFLKLKSRGTRVGTVQKFLNIYNNTSNKIDNDYGEGTVKAVMAFQKASGLNADGEAGADTFRAMIDWLKKQS